MSLIKRKRRASILKRNNNVSGIAMKDMGEELVNQKRCMQEGIADYWDVGTTAVFTKEQRKLNQGAGVKYSKLYE